MTDDRWDKDAVAATEREGKYIFATLAVGETKVYERIPLHLTHLPTEKQEEHYKEVLVRLHKKLWQVMREGTFG